MANEGAAFSVPVGATVRYGANGVFRERVIATGAGVCNTASFGGVDPVPGVVKFCEVLSNAPAPTPAPPAPTPPAPTPPAPTPPAPAPGPTPPAAGAAVLHFSPNGNNSWAGTVASPKRDLNGINLNTLPAGTVLRFERGGAWTIEQWRLVNPFTRRTAKLVFEDYGDGPLPLLQFTNTATAGIEYGANFFDRTVHEGYAIRNLALRGSGAGFGVWFKGNVSDATVEGCELTNWRQSFVGQGGEGNRADRILLLGNRIHSNFDTGVLGTFYNTLIAGNDFSDPTQEANHFVHRIYLSSGDGNVVRGNKAISANPARGGTFTFHGRVPTSLVIEDNEVVYGAGSDDGAWVISVTPYGPGPDVPIQGFNGLVVRNNKITNAGNTAISIMCAPGALVENNEIRLTHARYQAAVNYADDHEVAQNLRGPAGAQMPFNAPAGSTVSDNVFAEA